MKITYLGHSCFLLETQKAKILFDPFISPNQLANEIRTNSLDDTLISKLSVDQIECDYVLLSHGHEDHVADAEAILKRTGAKLVSNFEIVSWFGSKGISNIHPMNIGGGATFDFGKVKSVSAIHSSAMPDGSYGGNPGGFVIQADGKTLYYAGDTALTIDMKLIAEDFNLDVALLPVGDNFTMGVKDAIKASNFIGCNHVIGMHFDTFGYIKIDHEAAIKSFSEAGKNLMLMQIGETKEL
ncbi:MAG: metal-dependent hydrolase [Salibacteraceae bacterium]|nr:metal-dependent hydrolase [Salibacteraceae bacterium]